ncbi:glycosyltransferase family 2 protein [Methanolobus mangrovi]|uniref:Glycosyltransferase family 2 protein n=1 Tax=Methanolobus mangrovi TaxID=3072977 RepID=A0AA51UHC0_9EURY|nr:glycosyltransferase family 2 protein [Methanolobus mangrovi]WMW23233.1 glycosyltransferase family 2 protein [Methanolobus mangrovi]
MNPKVSVITVCYNAEEFIERAINSVLNQTYKNIEYLIIDGASKDNTIDIVNKYKSKIAFFLSEPDKGIYDAMNKGINASSGEILYFLNSDDQFYDYNVIENVVRFFHRNVAAEIVYGSIIRVDPDTNEAFVKSHNRVEKSFFIDNAICQQGIFFTKKSFDKVGLFDDTYKIAGDYEWELRAFYKYYLTTCYYPQVIAIYREGGISSLDQTFKLLQEERNKAVIEHFNKVELYIYWLTKKLIKKLAL